MDIMQEQTLLIFVPILLMLKTPVEFMRMKLQKKPVDPNNMNLGGLFLCSSQQLLSSRLSTFCSVKDKDIAHDWWLTDAATAVAVEVVDSFNASKIWDQWSGATFNAGNCR